MKWVIKDKPQANSITRLQYIAGGPMATPEISVLQAQKEIVHFAERMQRMFGMTRALLDEKDKKEFERQYERINKYEEIADNMELEIATYLEQVSNEHLDRRHRHRPHRQRPHHPSPQETGSLRQQHRQPTWLRLRV